MDCRSFFQFDPVCWRPMPCSRKWRGHIASVLTSVFMSLVQIFVMFPDTRKKSALFSKSFSWQYSDEYRYRVCVGFPAMLCYISCRKAIPFVTYWWSPTEPFDGFQGAVQKLRYASHFCRNISQLRGFTCIKCMDAYASLPLRA